MQGFQGQMRGGYRQNAYGAGAGAYGNYGTGYSSYRAAEPGPRMGSSTPYGAPGGGYGGGYGGQSGGYGGGGQTLKPVEWKSQDLIPFRKEFYVEDPRVAGMSNDEIEALRSKLEIRILSKGGAPNPIQTFNQLGFSDAILQSLKSASFISPSPIQAQAWPIILSGRDMIGIAETGSGKTLAFLIPAIIHINDQPPIGRQSRAAGPPGAFSNANMGPICLILAPTRELVEQIKDQCVKFARSLRTGVAYGGAPKRSQIYPLKSGVEILAACPGRLIDFVQRDVLSLGRVTFLVLDEADRMLDMGFEPQIRQIVSNIRPDRQTLMFSATWPKEVEGLARDLCREDPVHVTIGKRYKPCELEQFRMSERLCPRTTALIVV